MSTSTTGRRVATRRRPRSHRGGALGFVLVVLAGLLMAAIGTVFAEPEPPAEPETVPVDQATSACLASPERVSSRVATLAAPLPEAAAAATEDAGKGGVTVAAPGKRGRPLGGAPRGELRSVDPPARGSAVTISATGAAAAGRDTVQVDRVEGAGVAVQQCLAPRSRWWFTGAGADLDHQSTLVMANVDPGPAVVDVIVQGPDGVAEDVGTRGLTLAPGEVRAVPLVEVAPQADELAVHIEAARGRVAAGLSDAFATTPAADPGPEWLPAQAEASRVLRLGPLARRADRRTLVVANPAEREALVEVAIAGESGAFVPTDLPTVRVPPQSVVTADLGTAVRRDASAVVLRSQVPVTATVRTSRGSDSAYAAAAPSLDGPAAAVLDEGTPAEVQLTAGKEAGTATVAAYTSRGERVDSAKVKVPPTATAGWSPKSSAAYVVVTPGQGVLTGGVSLEGPDGLSQLPLRPLTVVLQQPAVVPVVR